jgi:hypothetical protein
MYIVNWFYPVPSGKQVSDSFVIADIKDKCRVDLTLFPNFLAGAGGKTHVTRGIFESLSAFPLRQ